MGPHLPMDGYPMDGYALCDTSIKVRRSMTKTGVSSCAVENQHICGCLLKRFDCTTCAYADMKTKAA